MVMEAMIVRMREPSKRICCKFVNYIWQLFWLLAGLGVFTLPMMLCTSSLYVFKQLSYRSNNLICL